MSDLRAPTCFSRCFKFQSEKSGPWCLPTMQHSFPKKQHSSDRLSKKGFSGQPSVVLTPSGTVILMQFSEVIPQVLSVQTRLGADTGTGKVCRGQWWPQHWAATWKQKISKRENKAPLTAWVWPLQSATLGAVSIKAIKIRHSHSKPT